MTRSRRTASHPVRVVIVWHMHQPSYRDPVHGAFVLPWVRLHALRDYLGMVRLLDATPDVHVTFNLVPSLLDQVEAYAKDEAQEGELRVGLRPAESLTGEERVLALRTLFLMSEPLMAPWPRLRELRERRGPSADDAALASAADAFDAQDLRDLQVLSKLAWFDLDWLEHDPVVRALAGKGRGFDEADKLRLRERELALLRSILPLLADTEAHREAHPHAPLPRRFHHPEDALDQIARARARHAELFGVRPEGLWPSEGSVSDVVVGLAAQAGVRWLASDEGVLERSLGVPIERHGDGGLGRPDLLYVPWVRRTASGDVRMLFRDRTLSDLIGFVYSRWRPEDAAADLLGRLKAVGEAWTSAGLPGVPVVPIILDGENAWEHFTDGGRVFLRALYRGLHEDPALSALTAAEALAVSPARELPRVFAGSWIHADFGVWIGHEDDRRAWDALGDARDALTHASPDGVPAADRERAWEAYRAAAGSDWCWWYGDDRSSVNDSDFDRLYRRHLEVVHRSLGHEPPSALRESFITTGAASRGATLPMGTVLPVLDGRLTSDDEWDQAGVVRAPQAGSMARGSAGIRTVRYGAAGPCLYVLVETGDDARTVLAAGEVRVDLGGPRAVRYRVVARDGATVVTRETRADARWAEEPTGAQAAAGEVLEISFPWPEIEDETGAVQFWVTLWQSGVEVERLPDGAAIGMRP
jgi:alpha-amylase/alpha-mannosidase (GH57 family)